MTTAATTGLAAGRCPFSMPIYDGIEARRPCFTPDDMLFFMPSAMAAAAANASHDAWPTRWQHTTAATRLRVPHAPSKFADSTIRCPGQCQDPCRFPESHLGHAWQAAGLGRRGGRSASARR